MEHTGDLKKQVEKADAKDKKKIMVDKKQIDAEQLEQVVGGGTSYHDYNIDDIISKDDILRSEIGGFDKEPNMRDPSFPGVIKW